MVKQESNYYKQKFGNFLWCALILTALAQCTSNNDYRRDNRGYAAAPQYPAPYYRSYVPRSNRYYNPYDFAPPYGRSPYTDYDQYYIAPSSVYQGEEEAVRNMANERDLR